MLESLGRVGRWGTTVPRKKYRAKGANSAIYNEMKETVHRNEEDLCNSIKCSKEAVNWELLEWSDIRCSSEKSANC